MTEPIPHAEQVRSFSRFYTRQLGLLEEGLLESPYSLPEARLLYELAHQETTTARQLSAQLALDPGYVSRLVRRLHDQGIVYKARSADDGRVSNLSLTDHGKSEFARLNAASRTQVESMLETLSDADRSRLVASMASIVEILGGSPEPRVPYILRPPEPGDLGWVIQRHGALYNREYNWDETFEALVAKVAAEFVDDFEPRRERCWIAEKDGENVGCVFLVEKSEDVAQLRLLLVEPRARGLGIGRRLVQECSRFAEKVGYKSVILWTNDILTAARKIYEDEGYELVEEEEHRSFGHDLVGQYWRLEL